MELSAITPPPDDILKSRSRRSAGVTVRVPGTVPAAPGHDAHARKPPGRRAVPDRRQAVPAVPEDGADPHQSADPIRAPLPNRTGTAHDTEKNIRH
jgi:hypothetical protein